MSDTIVIVEEDISVAVVAEPADTVTVREAVAEFVEVLAGIKGDKGDPGDNAVVLFGTGLPPDPTGLPDGALYIRHN